MRYWIMEFEYDSLFITDCVSIWTVLVWLIIKRIDSVLFLYTDFDFEGFFNLNLSVAVAIHSGEV